MEDQVLVNMDAEKLRRQEKSWRTQGRNLIAKANACRGELIRRDAEVALATAEAAKRRAQTGTCICPLRGCSVHQMGGKAGYDESWAKAVEEGVKRGLAVPGKP